MIGTGIRLGRGYGGEAGWRCGLEAGWRYGNEAKRLQYLILDVTSCILNCLLVSQCTWPVRKHLMMQLLQYNRTLIDQIQWLEIAQQT